MVRVRVCLCAALAACLLGAAPSAAAPADSSETSYALVTPPSALEVGCQGPCACPIVSTPTFGSFVLVRTGVDPLYTHYAVERYIASPNNGPGYVFIVGSGQYKIGGEVAQMQEMTLDLAIEGQPVQHFDSGLVPVRSPFPQVDIACAVHGFHCFDSVLVVSAKPIGTTNTPPPPRPRAGLQGVSPNPFGSRTSIAFSLDRPGAVDLQIVDLEGRRVRSLAGGEFAGAGPRTVTWDGRRDDGRAAPGGVYWVVLRWSGGVDRRRFVRVE